MNIKRFFENLMQMIEWNLISVLLNSHETGSNEYKSKLVCDIYIQEIIFYDKPKLIFYSINLTCMDKTFINTLRLSLTF